MTLGLVASLAVPGFSASASMRAVIAGVVTAVGVGLIAALLPGAACRAPRSGRSTPLSSKSTLLHSQHCGRIEGTGTPCADHQVALDALLDHVAWAPTAGPRPTGTLTELQTETRSGSVARGHVRVLLRCVEPGAPRRLRGCNFRIRIPRADRDARRRGDSTIDSCSTACQCRGGPALTCGSHRCGFV